MLEKALLKGVQKTIFSQMPISHIIKAISRSFGGVLSDLIKILADITIYSFRHSGAIEIFKRTGSITKLQRAMGHSSINVSLTYLRGLEIPELNEEDMPMI